DEAYVGMYDSLLFGPLAVTATNGGLEIALGPAPLKLPLAHYDRDVFTLESVGENAVGRTGVRFSIGPGERAGSVVIDWLDANGQGAFARRPS
ncbi:MAG: DUF3471 domain-containing protein, partial [Thermomicrobiales bacterium]|nr:DUF3471 domain-containing protein [Thermomicrobiales bacterium]